MPLPLVYLLLVNFSIYTPDLPKLMTKSLPAVASRARHNPFMLYHMTPQQASGMLIVLAVRTVKKG